ncbi:MAG: amidohydrolase [Devosia sp.]|nr:amidohydrolase [Devosia sp.]
MSIIDTHLHLVYKDRFSYPWLADAPAIDRQWTAESYFAEAEKLGIEGALHMEVDVAESDIEAETRFMTQVHPKVIGAIAAGRPESAGFPEWLEIANTIGGVKAIRRILHQSPNELSQTSLFVENLRRLQAYDMAFDLCVRADQLLPVGKPLVERCPDVQFVLDHCGVPDIAGGKFDSWRDAISEIARLPNLVCKVSGIIAYGGADPTAATLRPYVEHVISSFGWDRVVWGSDHPVCTLTANLTSWVGITNEIIAGASEGEKAALLRDNAKRVYRV